MLSEAAKQLMQLQRGGSYSLARDALKHRVYDTRYFDTTHSDNTFFIQPIGSSWRNSSQKSLNETNMYDSGKLPNGQVMLFTKMSIQFIPYAALDESAADDLIQSFYNIMDSSVFEIKIQGREWDYQIHGSEFLPAAKISGAIATNNPVRVGDLIHSGVSKLDPTPIVVDQLVSFQVIHRLGNPDSNIDTILDASCSALNTANSTMKVTLEGLLTRAK